MSLNLSKLDKEYDAFWEANDLDKAIKTLYNVNNYCMMSDGIGFTSYSLDTLLKPYNLVPFVAGYLNKSIQEIATWKYSSLIDQLKVVLDKNVSMMKDYKEREKAYEETGFFSGLTEPMTENIINPVKNFFADLWSGLETPAILLLSLAIIIIVFIIFKNIKDVQKIIS